MPSFDNGNGKGLFFYYTIMWVQSMSPSVVQMYRGVFWITQGFDVKHKNQLISFWVTGHKYEDVSLFITTI